VKQIKIYTDGGNSSKNAVGGWACVIIMPNDVEVEMSGAYLDITNNQAELAAVIEGLGYVYENENPKQVAVEVITDSEYVKKGATDWLPKWKTNGWKSKSKEPVKNKPLWEAIDAYLQEMNVKFTWVRGHSGDNYNEKADKLATSAYKKLAKSKQDSDKVDKRKS
jgi:ribonuclease HI